MTCLGHSPGAKLGLDPARLPYLKIRFVVFGHCGFPMFMHPLLIDMCLELVP